MDLNLEIQKALSKAIQEKLPEIIEKNTTKLVEDVVSDLFRWGEVKTQVKAKLESSLNTNLQEFDLIDYGALVSKVINDNLLQQVNLQPILDMTRDIVGFVDKKEITLQEIADMFIESSQEENEQSGSGEITFIVKEDFDNEWIEVFADSEADQAEHECSVRFMFSIKGSRDGRIFIFKMRDFYSSSEQQSVTPSRMVNIRNIEHKIFRLYSAQVKITNYDRDINTYWDRY